MLNAGIGNGVAERRAREAAARYADRQHRYRPAVIARTELATAYNEGAYGAALDAQAHGYIGDCKKTWLTAADERVCKVCAPLDGVGVNMSGFFPGGVKLPPAHPNCRCGVAFVEVAEPVVPMPGLTNPPDSGIMDVGDVNTMEAQQLGFEPAKTTREAEEYALNKFGIVADYQGWDLDLANAVNKEILDMRGVFGENCFDGALHRIERAPPGKLRSGAVGGFAWNTKNEQGRILFRDVSEGALLRMHGDAQYQAERGFWASGEASGVIRHEFGHAIERSLSQRGMTGLLKFVFGYCRHNNIYYSFIATITRI